MPVSYCRQHERLMNRKRKGWIDFPLEKMEAITVLYRFFNRAHIDTSEYLVIETACDKCEEIALQKLQDELKKVDHL
jgi:hypothetical protein